MLAQEVIRRKRDGAALSAEEIYFIVTGIADGSIGEGQCAAFAMAVFFRGMNQDERALLATAMAASGSILDWRSSDLPGPLLDKHSTGGVGDTVSLMLAPMVAACGGFVPMISGRGLGHTGGTLDKLQSIPGYDATPDVECFRRTVAEAGCAIIGQTTELAPADRRLYAVRDVTGTVESLDLITASILAKKLAAGLDGLVMDVKSGSGAFFAERAQAEELAASLVGVANRAGLRTTALITDMDQPLASAAGNALEVLLTVNYLTGAKGHDRLHEVVLALGAEMLLIGGLAETAETAMSRLQAALDSGAAAERFARMVAALGGPANLIEQPNAHLAHAPVTLPAMAREPGIVVGMDTRAVGLAVVELGGGRRRPEDAIDPAVGLSDIAPIGATVGSNRPLAVIHARDAAGAERALQAIAAAVRIGDAAPTPQPVILKHIGADAALARLQRQRKGYVR